MTIFPELENEFVRLATPATNPRHRSRQRLLSIGALVAVASVLTAVVIGISALMLLGRHNQTTASQNSETSASQPASRRTIGTTVKLPTPIRRFQGQPIVITVWATWCSICRADLSIDKTVAFRYDQAVVFITADDHDATQAARQYLSRDHIAFPSVPFGALRRLVPNRLIGLPTTIFINAEGRVTNRHVGAYRSASALAHDIATYVHPHADPASDVLTSQSYFIPWDAHATGAQQMELSKVITQAKRAGYHIRVAIIASKNDLGAIPGAWQKPEIYARTLATELSLGYHGPLLVVMPAGLGFYEPGTTLAADKAILGHGAPSTRTKNLAVIAAEEVARLTDANKRKTKP